MYMKVKYDNGEIEEFYAFHQFLDRVNYDNIIEINCKNCDLILLPDKLPSNLEVLICCMNKLTGLPDLPSSLRLLNANFNQLYLLPELIHTNLEELYVSKNNLEVIPELPQTLQMLFVLNNDITALPKELPPNLDSLFFDWDKMKSIPSSIMKLDKLNNIHLIKDDNLFIDPEIKKWLNERFDF